MGSPVKVVKICFAYVVKPFTATGEVVKVCSGRESRPEVRSNKMTTDFHRERLIEPTVGNGFCLIFMRFLSGDPAARGLRSRED